MEKEKTELKTWACWDQIAHDSYTNELKDSGITLHELLVNEIELDYLKAEEPKLYW